MFRRGKREPQRPEGGPEVFSALRSQVLNLDPGSVGIGPSPELPRVFGVVMDMGYPEGTATLVALADGTTSLYTSGGGGVIGAGEHESVAAVTRRLLLVAESHVKHLAVRHQVELPPVGRVLINVLTYSGRFTAEAPTDDLGEGRHPVSPVFHAAHEVIHAVHMTEEGARGGAPPPLPGSATTLMAAAYHRDLATARRLIEAGDDLEARDVDGYTPLMYAANAGAEEIVSALLAAGADPNAGDDQRSTPLMFAAQHDHLGIVRQLLAAGSNPNARGTHGLTALGFAQQNGHQRVAAVLISAGAT
jgi:hypothetical protein